MLSLEDAIELVADTLTELIAATTDTGIAAALRAARDELIGNHGGTPPTNGALDKLEADDPVAAITKLKAAIAKLVTAESRGAGDLSALKDLLGLVAEGIATAEYHEAQAAVSPPSPGQAQDLADDRRGHRARTSAAGRPRVSRRRATPSGRRRRRRSRLQR